MRGDSTRDTNVAWPRRAGDAVEPERLKSGECGDKEAPETGGRGEGVVLRGGVAMGEAGAARGMAASGVATRGTDSRLLRGVAGADPADLSAGSSSSRFQAIRAALFIRMSRGAKGASAARRRESLVGWAAERAESSELRAAPLDQATLAPLGVTW